MFRQKALDNYEELNEIFCNTTATGVNAITPASSQLPRRGCQLGYQTTQDSQDESSNSGLQPNPDWFEGEISYYRERYSDIGQPSGGGNWRNSGRVESFEND